MNPKGSVEFLNVWYLSMVATLVKFHNYQIDRPTLSLQMQSWLHKDNVVPPSIFYSRTWNATAPVSILTLVPPHVWDTAAAAAGRAQEGGPTITIDLLHRHSALTKEKRLTNRII